MVGAVCFDHYLEIVENVVMLTASGENHTNYQRLLLQHEFSHILTQKPLQKLIKGQTLYITITLNNV